MSLDTLLLVFAIHAVALISPGPDFAVVTRLSIVSGRRAGMWFPFPSLAASPLVCRSRFLAILKVGDE